MVRDGEQKGRPYEPRTVRMKSELRGVGRVALPLVFRRGEDGRWRAKWLHLYLKGISGGGKPLHGLATGHASTQPGIRSRRFSRVITRDPLLIHFP